ncbi:MAG TPA: hypothetical protein VFV52_06950 [Bacilli bacterium]|nr:hypothetical protein [Bacilli bacterium]
MGTLLLDTNVLRYRAGASAQCDVSACWDFVSDPHNGYDVYVSDETLRELKVQRYVLRPDEAHLLFEQVVPHLDTLSFAGDLEREHLVRELASYVKRTYRLQVPASAHQTAGKEMQYPSVSDARILLTALDAGATLVTKNVKDFLVYLLFGYVIWDPVDNYSIVLTQDLWDELQEDEGVQDLVERICEYPVGTLSCKKT